MDKNTKVNYILPTKVKNTQSQSEVFETMLFARGNKKEQGQLYLYQTKQTKPNDN